MRNEARHIAQFARDVAVQDVEAELDLIVADGASDDDSVAILEAECDRLGLRLTVVSNPQRIVPTGLNECIRASTADLLVRMDCHSSYPADYVRRLVAVAEETGAWNVGGVVIPEGHTPMERAVAAAMDSPFGGIGWTRHGDGGERVEVDTVTFGAFRPEAFRHAGMFDEHFVRNQDDEFNLRLRRAGGRIVLDPAVSVRYTPRGSWRGVFRQYYEYGLWKIPVMRKHHAVLGVRSLAPIVLVGSVALLAPLAGPFVWARLALGGELLAYAGAAGASAVRAVKKRREPLSQTPRVLVTFPAFHLGYGIGMAHGLLRALRRR
jgi:GT2 family glycosyltransferase